MCLVPDIKDGKSNPFPKNGVFGKSHIQSCPVSHKYSENLD